MTLSHIPTFAVGDVAAYCTVAALAGVAGHPVVRALVEYLAGARVTATPAVRATAYLAGTHYDAATGTRGGG